MVLGLAVLTVLAAGELTDAQVMAKAMEIRSAVQSAAAPDAVLAAPVEKGRIDRQGAEARQRIIDATGESLVIVFFDDGVYVSLGATTGVLNTYSDPRQVQSAIREPFTLQGLKSKVGECFRAVTGDRTFRVERDSSSAEMFPTEHFSIQRNRDGLWYSHRCGAQAEMESSTGVLRWLTLEAMPSRPLVTTPSVTPDQAIAIMAQALEQEGIGAWETRQGPDLVVSRLWGQVRDRVRPPADLAAEAKEGRGHLYYEASVTTLIGQGGCYVVVDATRPRIAQLQTSWGGLGSTVREAKVWSWDLKDARMLTKRGSVGVGRGEISEASGSPSLEHPLSIPYVAGKTVAMAKVDLDARLISVRVGRQTYFGKMAPHLANELAKKAK